MFLLFQESDYHWKYHGRVSPLLGIECPGLDGLIQSIHDKTLPRNLVKIEPKNLPPSYQWKMSALRNRLIFCSPRSLVKVYSRKIPLITCRNEMKTVHSTVHHSGSLFTCCYRQHPRKVVPQTEWCLQRICCQWSLWRNSPTHWRPTCRCVEKL